MPKAKKIPTLFRDIGGALLSDGRICLESGLPINYIQIKPE